MAISNSYVSLPEGISSVMISNYTHTYTSHTSRLQRPVQVQALAQPRPPVAAHGQGQTEPWHRCAWRMIYGLIYGLIYPLVI